MVELMLCQRTQYASKWAGSLPPPTAFLLWNRAQYRHYLRGMRSFV